ncbi:hypothetical protein CEE39_03795 [bacterium (candidate division B38) B3_B38]|nr:MAG: hypothetical protein CEE39_03795 [bacterium (candidate division B38) B3_B38]
MNKGDLKRWIISFLLLPIFLLTVEGAYSHPSINCEQASSQEELQGSLKKWHEGPVGYIILKDEKDRFKKLKTREERMMFIQIFWERRDYNPETLIHEFKEEFYGRVDYANQNFKEGGLEGWKTARGQIYIVLGPPDREWKEIVSGISARPAYLWQYYRLASAYLNPNEPLVFADLYGSGKYFLLRPYPQTYADYYWQVQKGRSYFEPVPDEYQRALDDIKKKFIFRPDVSYDQPPTTPPAQIKEPLPPKLPFNWKTSFSEHSSELTAIHLTVMVRYADFQYYREGDTYKVSVRFLGELKDKTGTLVDQVTEDISFSLASEEITEKKDALYTLTTLLKAKPGKYQLVLQLIDNLSGVTSRSVDTISVPAPE